MIYTNAWGKAKLISFLLTQKCKEPIEQGLIDFMENFERKR